LCNVKISGFDQSLWLKLALIAIIPQVIGHTLINWALGFLHPSYIALSILLEPFIGSVIAIIFICEHVSISSILGGVLIVIGVSTTFSRSSKAMG
jgi:drug/metabolite transporter (DMT)-like permease